MARKSNRQLLIERLASISECPFDIFELLDADDGLFDTIAAAESGCIDSMSKILSKLFAVCSDSDTCNDAVLYWADKACEFELVEQTLQFIDYSIRYNVGFDIALRGLAMISNLGMDGLMQDLDGVSEELTVLHIIEQSSDEEKLDELIEKLRSLTPNGYIAEMLFLLAKGVKKDAKKYSENCISVASFASIRSILPLTSFGLTEEKYLPNEDERAREIALLKPVLYKRANSDWRDFWARILYEYVNVYLQSDYKLIAEDIISVSLGRAHDTKRNLHALVWSDYLLKNNELMDEEHVERLRVEYDDLKKICIFEGYGEEPDKAGADILMREAVYTVDSEEAQHLAIREANGFVIRHKNNRFLMEGELSCHSKRGKKHAWGFSMSFPKQYAEKGEPKFKNLAVESVNYNVTRNGVTLNNDKNVSQVLFRSEIVISDAKYPFFIDFILDIAYISSVKCQIGELRVKKTKENDDLITYYCLLLLS